MLNEEQVLKQIETVNDRIATLEAAEPVRKKALEEAKRKYDDGEISLVEMWDEERRATTISTALRSLYRRRGELQRDLGFARQQRRFNPERFGVAFRRRIQGETRAAMERKPGGGSDD